MTDFCMLLSTPFPLAPNNFCVTSSRMILCCSTTYPLNCCLSSHLIGPYFRVFSASLRVRFYIHGKLIASVVTFLDLCFMIRASTLLALTSVCTAYTGISQNAWASLISHVGFSSTGEYQGGTSSK